ncbi:Ig-like domain repeat protein [Paenibacillus aestuarii]|uniref:Ig-like domain repeat protein n=1 Tax=Paenibacillus aestuarii TaxID=516965 RepID=A0ABW0KCI3_9BACL|nr:Ig-like domain repeat protein [Paenibacillus aestuarii]
MKKLVTAISTALLLVSTALPYPTTLLAATLQPAGAVKQPTSITISSANGTVQPVNGKYFFTDGQTIKLAVAFESSNPTVKCSMESTVPVLLNGKQDWIYLYDAVYEGYSAPVYARGITADMPSGPITFQSGPDSCGPSNGTSIPAPLWPNGANATTYFTDGTSMNNVAYFNSLIPAPVYIDNTAPTITFGNLPTDSSYKNAFNITLTSNDLPVNENVNMYYTWTQTSAAPAAAAINTAITSGTAAADPTAPGMYYLHARAVDVVGHEVIQTKGPFYLDKTAPTITFGMQSDTTYKKSHGVTITTADTPSTADTSLFFVWTQSATPPAASGITGSLVNGAAPVEPTGTGAYYLHAKAVDLAGNTTIKTAGPFNYDNQAPAVTISPMSGDAKLSHTVTYTVSDAHSGLKQVSYEWLKDGVSYSTGAGSITGGTLTVPNTAEGKYTLKLTATDNLNNVKTQDSLVFIIDKTAPTVSFTTQGNSVPSSSRQVGVTLSEATGTLSQAYSLWSDNVNTPAAGDVGWQLFFDGSGSLTSKSATLTSPAGANGTQFLHIKTLDSAGNIGYAKTTQGFVLDNTKPSVSFTVPSTSLYSKTVSTDLNISDNITTNVANFVIKYIVSDQAATNGDDSTWSSSTSRTLSIADKTGIFYIHTKVYDEAGNWTLATGGPYKLDNALPTGAITVPKKFTNVTTVPLQLTAADLQGSVDQMRFAVDGGAWGSWETFVSSKTMIISATQGVRTIAVQYKDAAGNISTTYADTVTYDITKPTLTGITYSAASWTNQPVTATLTAADNVTAVENITVDGLTGLSYQFQTNGSYTFNFKDQAGNVNTATATVTWIDKTKPVITLGTNGSPAAKSVSTAVYATDTGAPVSDLSFAHAWSTSGTTVPTVWSPLGANHIAEKNGVTGTWYLWVKVTDAAGNIATLCSNPFLLDNTSPVGTITYNPAGLTANNVTATLTTDEPVTVTNTSQGKKEHVFTDNGEFQFEFKDAAGNMGTAKAIVNWIDRSLPSAEVTLSPHGPTNGPVRVTIDASGDPERELFDLSPTGDGYGVSQTVSGAVYEFMTNGTLQYKVRNVSTGLTSSEQVSIDNIDMIPPTGELIYSTTAPTNQDVTVMLMTEDDKNGTVTILNNNGSPTYTFTDNGSFTFEFRDEAGNIATRTATVNNMDKEAPVAALSYSQTGWTNQDVNVDISFTDSSQVIVTNNGGSTRHTFTNNGTFLFEYRDAAGNEGEIEAAVTYIDREAPSASIAYSQSGWTNQDVVATLTAVDNSGEQVQLVSSGGTQVTFTSNGTHTFVFQDAAGNQGELTATVDRIDKTPPVAAIQYSETVMTRSDVRATVVADEPFTVIGNGGSINYDFTANGTYTFVIADRAGNQSTIKASVNLIDRTPPVPKLTYSTMAPTKDDVIVTVDANEPFYVLNNNRAKQVVFKENGTFTFYIQDQVGNLTEITASVNNINKTKAKVTATFSEVKPTKNDVTVTLTSDQPLTYTGITGNKLTFTANGTRWIEAVDALGNKYSLRVDVSNIDREAPILHFIGGDQLLVQAGGTVNPLEDVTASDNTDGDMTAKITVIQNTINPGVPGEYAVTYKVTDQAGNEATVIRKAAVIAPTDFTVYVNSVKVQDTDVVVYGDAIQLSLFGKQGASVVKWLRGPKYMGDFKMNANLVSNGILPITDYGYYTLLIQDQERQMKLIHVYILPKQTA